MDTTLTIIFYAFSGLAIAGSLAATVVPARRGLALVAVAIGAAGALASVSAGFAALLALVALGACAVLIGGLPLDATARPAGGGSRSPGAGAVLAVLLPVLLLGALVYAAWRGDFASGAYPGGWFGAAALGRAFLGRDALAFDAVAAMLLVGLAGAAIARGRR